MIGKAGPAASAIVAVAAVAAAARNDLRLEEVKPADGALYLSIVIISLF